MSSITSFNGDSVATQVVVRPDFTFFKKFARSRTCKCLETAASDILNGSASSLTFVSPWAIRARIARRVGSDRACSERSSVLEE